MKLLSPKIILWEEYLSRKVFAMWFLITFVQLVTVSHDEHFATYICLKQNYSYRKIFTEISFSYLQQSALKQLETILDKLIAKEIFVKSFNC